MTGCLFCVICRLMMGKWMVWVKVRLRKIFKLACDNLQEQVKIRSKNVILQFTSTQSSPHSFSVFLYIPMFCETLQGSQIRTLFNRIRCHVLLKGKFERNNGVGQTAEWSLVFVLSTHVNVAAPERQLIWWTISTKRHNIWKYLGGGV